MPLSINHPNIDTMNNDSNTVLGACPAMEEKDDIAQKHETANLSNIPPEIIHLILLYLDIPDLLSISRCTHRLRRLAVDPHLHHLRLVSASSTIDHYLPHRPSATSLRPPVSSILLSRTHIVARAISRSLISIRLARGLAARPPATDLVSRHILPAECIGYLGPVAPGILQRKLELGKTKLKDGLRGKLERRKSAKSLVEMNILPVECFRLGKQRGATVAHPEESAGRSKKETLGHVRSTDDGEYGYLAIAPGLIETRRKVIKESLKDGLRAWVEKRAILVQRRARKEVVSDYDYYYYSSKLADNYDDDKSQQQQQQRISVKLLARRFAKSVQQQTSSSSHNIGYGNCSCEKHAMQRRNRGTRRWEPPQSLSTRQTSNGCAQPTRAHVLSLRRFWEGVIRGSA